MTATFTKTNIEEIPKEDAHDGSGSRKMIVKPKQLTSPYFEAATKAFLKPGSIFDWHSHKDVDEFFIVIRGRGQFYFDDEVVDYKEGDVITIPANHKHKIVAGGDVENEYYFFRITAK